MTERFGLKEATITAICTVLSRFPQVEQAILYGSRARGNYTHGSDIDLSLCGGQDLTLGVFSKISHELDDLLLPYSIDLTIFAQIADPDLLEQIQRVGVLLYQRTATTS